MNCIVTAGPTFETLDKVRRLTNFSTGRLGIGLAGFLSSRGHDVTLLVGEAATCNAERRARQVQSFTTSADLRERLQTLAAQPVRAVFHAAAVGDFLFGRVWSRSTHGDLSEINAGKISTRHGTLLAELVPTPKIIASLRDWFPKAQIVGWKYEVDGKRANALAAARKQVAEYLIDASVANGPAYADGFGMVESEGDPLHLPDRDALFEALDRLIRG
jgi:phosphopantothenoylcysteine decarboxylase/phosphopantothenate--cysteine ligase